MRVEIVELVADGERVVGRRFRNVDEVYFFQVADGRIAAAWGIEDTLSRLRQLGLPADVDPTSRG